MANDDSYKKSIQAQIKIQQENLKAQQLPPVNKGNEKRQEAIKQEISNLKVNLKKK